MKAKGSEAPHFEGFRPNVAPRPVPTGRALKMVQSGLRIIPVDQF